MGKCPSTFKYDTSPPPRPVWPLTRRRLTYEPVALTFSFTSKELQSDPLPALRERFESVDVKLLVDYAIHHTTHVVSKKRNTAKGLQALVNGRFIVSEPYLDAISQAAQSVPQENGADTCPLEQDYDMHWPNPMDYLPPRGAEPVNHPDSIYAPDKARQEIFEGYTFIFYDSNQYNNLMAPITNGGGKALLEHILPGETPVDDFIRYVKTVAGEKGLGSFDDGNEGRGVVLVRYLPAKGDHVQWFADFFTNVSLRLDHRPIEQNEFLEAILVKDASMLRRPLEVEPAGDENVVPEAPAPITQETMVEEPVVKVSPSKRRARGPIKRRFAGFDEADISVDMEEIPQFVPPPARGRDTEEGLFVSQEVPQQDDAADVDMGSPRKRAADAMEEDELMEDVAPAAARLKRQRVARGETLEAPEPESPPKSAAKPPPKKKKELDVLAAAKKHREEEEARARAEQEDLTNLPADIDLAEIRRLNIVEEVELRSASSASRTREQDISDGRWDPKWNGVKNFKKFRQRGQATGRQPARTIVPLEEAKTKEFGVGDTYWLEDDSAQANRNKSVSQQSNAISELPSARRTVHTPSADNVLVPATVDDDVDSLLAEDSQPVRTGSRSQRSRVTQTQSQGSKGTSQAASSRANQNPSKRPAPESSISQSSSKRPRTMPKFMQNQDSDDSDDDLKFKFGRRR